jgi:hypothetical protein
MAVKRTSDHREPVSPKGKQAEDANDDLELSDDAAQKVKGAIQRIRNVGSWK